MTKKIAVINDLSGFGRCSLTAAISVISAMGVQACPLPTAILTAQTGYSSYYCDDYTDKMERYRREWSGMNQHFDGIYSGFVASEEQLQHISRFVDTFYEEQTFLLVDPVMGDEGVTYALFTERLRQRMRDLALRADIITPNLTELCLLADVDYRKLQEMKDKDALTAAIDALGKRLCSDGPGHVIVTGIHFTDHGGVSQMGNLYITSQDCFLSAFPYIGGSYSGTGDLFASCVAAGVARGDSIPHTIETAGAFLELALTDSVRENVPRNDGVNYEKYLSHLLPAERFCP